VLKFEVSGQRYEIDLSPEKLMGDELLLIDDQLEQGWAHRWANEEFGVRDIVVLTYLSAKRNGEERPFAEFVKTIAPLTFRELDEKPASAQPRAKAKTAPLEGGLGPMVRTARSTKKAAAKS
jgi:hypothetical protein